MVQKLKNYDMSNPCPVFLPLKAYQGAISIHAFVTSCSEHIREGWFGGTIQEYTHACSIFERLHQPLVTKS